MNSAIRTEYAPGKLSPEGLRDPPPVTSRIDLSETIFTRANLTYQ